MCCYLFCGTQKDKFLLRTLVCKRAVEHEDTLLCFKWQHMGCRLNNDYSWSRIEIHKSNSKIFSISLTNKFNWVCFESFCFMASQKSSGPAGLNRISYTHWSLDSCDFSVSPALYSERTKSKWFTHDNTIIRLGDLPLHLLIKQFQLARVSDDCVFFYPILDTFEPNGICWLGYVGI